MSRAAGSPVTRASLLHREPVIWLAAFLTALAGHEAATAFVERMEGHSAPWLIALLLTFLVCTLFFYRAYDNPLPQKLDDRIRRKVDVGGAMPWVLCAAAFILLFAFAAEVHQTLAGHFEPALLFGYLIAFVLVAFWARHLVRGQLLVVHSRYLNQEALPDEGAGARHLVLLLSNADEKYRDSGWLPGDMTWSDSISADVDELKRRGIRWNWEMPLRGIRPHQDTLETITLICSKESMPQAAAFAAHVRTYPHLTNLPVRVWCERAEKRTLVDPSDISGCRGFSFNDVDELSSGMVDLLKYLRFEQHAKPREIMIDYTGGQKPASVVAAAVTLRGELRAQYVDTNDRRALEYDLVMNPEPRDVG